MITTAAAARHTEVNGDRVMSDEHADKIRGRAGTPTPGAEKSAPVIDPAMFERDDVRTALAGHDISTLYRALNDGGISQRQIARRTGQSQSEVSEILAGRRVMAYDVLVRIAEGLGIPRQLMGLGYGTSGGDAAYRGEVTVAGAPEGVSTEMLRRHVLALGGVATFGRTIKGLGELMSIGGLVDVSGPAPAQRPSRLFWVHVAHVRDLTGSLRDAIHAHGANPQVSGAATTWADQLLGVPGTDLVKGALLAAVAELHTVAGWAGLDAGFLDRAMYHYGRALELATEAGDAYLQAVAQAGAGMVMVEHGHPDDGLKMLQLGQLKSWDIAPDNDRRTVVTACVLADSVPALVALGKPDAAYTELAKSRQVWTPTRTDPWGDPDGVGARLELARGRLDVAEPLAAASVRRWEGLSERARTLSGIVLATIHVQAGDRRGLPLAHGAITDVMRISSVQARTRLEPLAAALEARSGSDAHELARMARQVAATRV